MIINKSIAQTRFGNVKCDSFQITVDSSQALVFRKKKRGVFDLNEDKYLIKPTKEDIQFLPGTNFYLQITEELITLIDFAEENEYLANHGISAKNELLFCETFEGNKQMLKDGKWYVIGKNREGNTSWIGKVDTSSKLTSTPRVPEPIYFIQKVGGKRYNDSLLLIYNRRFDYFDPFTGPLESILHPGEDSVVLDPETGYVLTIYPPPIVGYEHDGIYHCEQKDWILHEGFRILITAEQGVLINHVERDVDNVEDGGFYELVNYDGRSLGRREYEELGSDMNFVRILMNLDTISIAPKGMRGHGQISKDNWYYGKVGNEYAVIGAIEIPEQISVYKPFIHFSPTYDYFFWIEKDSLYLEINDSVFVAPKNSKIQCWVKDYLDYDYAVSIITEGDTSFFKTEGFSTRYMDIPYGSIEQIGNILIINDMDYYDNYWPNIEYIDMGYDEMFDPDDLVMYQTENSSIWEFEDGEWKKRTTYYNEVLKAGCGYLVNTGDFMKVMNVDDFEMIDHPGRYILLDTTFKAMSFMDYFDFTKGEVYPFGVSLCLDTGCFFIDNKGKVVTDAEWDVFELENEKLKAIKLNDLDEDFYWDYDPEVLYEKVEYFELNSN